MPDPRSRTVRDYLRVLRTRWVTIVVLTIAGALVALGLSLSQKRSYVATASVSFQEESRSDAEAGLAPILTTQTAAQLAAQGASTMLGAEVLSRVRSRLRSTLPIATLRGMLATSVDPSSTLVTVTATGSNTQFVAAVANAVARSAVAIQTKVDRHQFASTARRVQRQYDALSSQSNPSHPTDLAVASLLDRIATLRTLAANASPARLIQAATVPASPSSPRPLRSTIFGGLIGLILGIGLAFVRDALDRRLRDSGEIEQTLSLPVVGRVRRQAMGNAAYVGNNGRGPMSDQDVESFRMLRANIEVLDVDRSLKSILVTSPLPEEGKSTVAASLAAANAAAGKRTLLVECDLRRPCLSERLSIDRYPGLSDYLAGRATPAEVVQVVTLSDSLPPKAENGGGGPPAPADAEAAQLVVIAAGSQSIRPAELLASERFRTFLEETTAAYDTVVIDTPPLLAASDTLELVPLADCVLLCIRADQTTTDQARAGKEALAPQREGGRTAIVVTGMKPGREHDYGDYLSDYYREQQVADRWSLGRTRPDAHRLNALSPSRAGSGLRRHFRRGGWHSGANATRRMARQAVARLAGR